MQVLRYRSNSNWNGPTTSYDANGNMLSDGSNTFAWNARNQVATLNNVSLQYDAFGRRSKNAAGASFLYNGANAAQELSGSTITANLLGGGIDEFFTRTDSSGAFTPLQDALGSAIALVNSSGSIATSYSYDPFGNTTVSGATSGNPSQYTGRENEGNGLYYYRARYYSSFLARFVSEDPLRFSGSGPNFYVYVFDNPINLTDPAGLQSKKPPLPLRTCIVKTPTCSSEGVAEPPADYQSLTVGYGLGALNIQHDRFNNWYWTPGGATGWSYGKLGASYTYGYLETNNALHGRKPNEKEIENFLTSWGGQACIGFGGGYCRTWSPGAGFANEYGGFTPQVSVSGGYTFRLRIPPPTPADPVAPDTQIPLGDGLYWTTETPWDTGPPE